MAAEYSPSSMRNLHHRMPPSRPSPRKSSRNYSDPSRRDRSEARWQSQSMQNINWSPNSIRRSPSPTLYDLGRNGNGTLNHNDEEEEIIEITGRDNDDEQPLASKARQNWLHIDSQLKRNSRNLQRKQRPRQSSWNHPVPRTPQPSSQRSMGVATNTYFQNNYPRSPGSPENPRSSRWNDGISKSNDYKSAAPKSWHGGRKKWTPSGSPLSYKPGISLSPPVASDEMMKRRSVFEDDKSVGSISGRWRTSSSRRLPEPVPDLNVSMSSMAPQLPKRYEKRSRRAQGSPKTKPMSVKGKGGDLNTVVRGHKVYNIQSAAKDRHVDNFIPASAMSNSDDDSRWWIRHDSQDVSDHPSSILEGDADSHEKTIMDGTSEKASTNSELLGQQILDIEDSYDSGTNDRRFSVSGAQNQKIGLNIEDEILCTYEELNDRRSDSKEDLIEDGLQYADSSRMQELVVDKVPTMKRWSSKNVENFPVWPPIIKVEKYEKRNVSGISIGSGFSDDLTASEGDFLSSLGDDDLSTQAELALLLPEQKTSYRIRYDGPTNLENLDSIYKLPPVPIHDERFEPTAPPADGTPNQPSRSGKTDELPHAPRRYQSTVDRDDEVSINTEQIGSVKSRPDVWITPLSGDEVKNAVWKVKRVWAVVEEDEKEQEHSVHNKELFQKIKSLVGAPDSPSHASSPGESSRKTEDVTPRRPSRSWHVQTVVERNGRLDDLEPEKEFADDEFEQNIDKMAEEAVKEIEINDKAIEEAKKRIKMLKGSDPLHQRKTPRRAPRQLKRQMDGEKGKENEVLNIPVPPIGMDSPVLKMDSKAPIKDTEIIREPAQEELEGFQDEGKIHDTVRPTGLSNVTHIHSPRNLIEKIENQPNDLSEKTGETAANSLISLLPSQETEPVSQLKEFRQQEQVEESEGSMRTPVGDVLVNGSNKELQTPPVVEDADDHEDLQVPLIIEPRTPPIDKPKKKKKSKHSSKHKEDFQDFPQKSPKKSPKKKKKKTKDGEKRSNGEKERRAKKTKKAKLKGNDSVSHVISDGGLTTPKRRQLGLSAMVNDSDSETSEDGMRTPFQDPPGTYEYDDDSIEDSKSSPGKSEREKIHAAAMVHNSDSESDWDDELSDEEFAAKEITSGSRRRLLRETTAVPWWQKNEETTPGTAPQTPTKKGKLSKNGKRGSGEFQSPPLTGK